MQRMNLAVFVCILHCTTTSGQVIPASQEQCHQSGAMMSLQAEADEFAASAAAAAAGKPLPPHTDSSYRAQQQQIPMNQSRGSTMTESRGSSVSGSRGGTLDKVTQETYENPAAPPPQTSAQPLDDLPQAAANNVSSLPGSGMIHI